MTIDSVDKVVTFGGEYRKFLDSIEVYHTNTGSWELLDKSLTESRNNFGYLTINQQTVFDLASTNDSFKPILITLAQLYLGMACTLSIYYPFLFLSKYSMK